MRIYEIVALDPYLSLRIFVDFIFKSASTLARRVDSSRAGAQRSAMKGKLEISVLSLTPELR